MIRKTAQCNSAKKQRAESNRGYYVYADDKPKHDADLIEKKEPI